MDNLKDESGGVPQEILAAQHARAETLRAELEGLSLSGRSIVVEFGCGHGHWLTSYAEAFPNKYCLGIDLLSGRVRKANAKRDRRELSNLHFIKAEAAELLRVWPEGYEIEAAFMLFPDPWPKKRHFKNRMVQVEFMEQLAGRMLPNAPFHFRTDHEGYFSWSEELLKTHPDWALLEDVEWPWEAGSYFQEKMDSWQSLIANNLRAKHPTS